MQGAILKLQPNDRRTYNYDRMYPKENFWAFCTHFLVVLNIFNAFTTLVGGDQYPTAALMVSMIFNIMGQLDSVIRKHDLAAAAASQSSGSLNRAARTNSVASVSVRASAGTSGPASTHSALPQWVIEICKTLRAKLKKYWSINKISAPFLKAYLLDPSLHKTFPNANILAKERRRQLEEDLIEEGARLLANREQQEQAQRTQAANGNSDSYIPPRAPTP